MEYEVGLLRSRKGTRSSRVLSWPRTMAIVESFLIALSREETSSLYTKIKIQNLWNWDHHYLELVHEDGNREEFVIRLHFQSKKISESDETKISSLLLSNETLTHTSLRP